MIHTVNLPVDTLTHIINIDDKRVLVPVNEINEFNNDETSIRSMYTMPETNNKDIAFISEIAWILNFNKLEVKETNEVRYFKLRIKFFPCEKEVDMIIPSYVKLFSRTAKTFVPVEFARKSDILADYTGNIAQILSNELIENYTPTEYYNMRVSIVNTDHLITFYLNGILANVCYNDFDIKK